MINKQITKLSEYEKQKSKQENRALIHRCEELELISDSLDKISLSSSSSDNDNENNKNRPNHDNESNKSFSNIQDERRRSSIPLIQASQKQLHINQLAGMLFGLNLKQF